MVILGICPNGFYGQESWMVVAWLRGPEAIVADLATVFRLFASLFQRPAKTNSNKQQHIVSSPFTWAKFCTA